jgi:hypothetical protein
VSPPSSSTCTSSSACKRRRIQGYFEEDYALDASGDWEYHTAAPCSPEKIMQQTNQYMEWKTLAKRVVGFS